MHIPKGYTFAATAAGFKYEGRDDLALIVSEVPAHAAGVFTTNRFQAAPVLVARENLERGGRIRALLVNSGQANACTGQEGLDRCRDTLTMLNTFGLSWMEVLPASTGVIGDQLRMDLWEKALPGLQAVLGQSSPLDAARAIMTTDTFPKIVSREVRLSGGTVRLLGLCKGAGMISPNMATMLGFVLCDAVVDGAWWRETLKEAVRVSFNAVTVDGDTSTNDCVLALANGMSGVELSEADRLVLAEELTGLCQDLAFQIVQDAEGGTKVMHIEVAGAQDDAQADLAARAVGNSPLVKTALYGRDPNWGRIVAALGRSGAEFDPNAVSVSIGGQMIFENGRPVEGDWDALLAPVLRRDEVVIGISLGDGEGRALLFASDLTEEYIRINAEYRT
jgi:glutamate N-acetyltransferase/amino-acid N-acetyltransferase